MPSEENKTVETPVENAVAQPGNEPASNDSEVDYEAILAAKDAELAKVTTEKENYRRGLLKAKGKDLPEDDGASETQEEMLRRIVREEQLSSREAQLAAEKDAAMKALIKQNKELRLAMKGTNTVGVVGANEAKNNINAAPEFFSKEQLAELKKRGVDPEKAKANMLKRAQSPQIAS